MSFDIYVISAGILWIADKAGFFSWVSKLLHSRLPREKSMVVRHLLKPGRYRITTTEGIQITASRERIEVIDNVLIVNNTMAIAHFAWSRLELVDDGKEPN